METVFGFAALVMATILGLFGALALQALLLRVTFALMQPTTAERNGFSRLGQAAPPGRAAAFHRESKQPVL
jgi:hypothetical protein